MPSKFVRIAISDAEHVDEAELAEFDLETWEHEKEEDLRMKVVQTNGTILNISLALLLLCLLIACIIVSTVYVSPLCVDKGSSKWISLQYFLFYDSVLLGFCFLVTAALLILANYSYPEHTIKFAQFCGGLALVGMFAVQVVECIVYGKLFISTDSICPLPVATMTIVMNLLFFGGPLLVFCCVALGRTSALNFSDEMFDVDDEEGGGGGGGGGGAGGGEGGGGGGGGGEVQGEGEGEEEGALVLPHQPLLADEEHV